MKTKLYPVVTMRRCFAFLVLLFFAFSGQAMAQEKVTCGSYSFDLPDDYEVRMHETNAPNFDKTLTINDVFDQKDLGRAIIYCIREKKTEYRSFALPAKERINLQIAPRRNTQMFISATEDVVQAGMRLTFNLLEERTSNSREIRGRERFMVAIEIGAANDSAHTMLFICDFRKIDGFFDAEDYKSQVTSTATQVMDSLKKLQ